VFEPDTLSVAVCPGHRAVGEETAAMPLPLLTSTVTVALALQPAADPSTVYIVVTEGVTTGDDPVTGPGNHV
jgi:hypothetical protein